MKPEDLVCWKCGTSLAGVALPLRRLEECPGCGADLHVCKLCEFYDTRVAKHCREPVADEVKDKERANFCDYFQPRPDAYTAPTGEGDAARAQLDALFGVAPDAGSGGSGADAAKSELERLFGLKDEDKH